MALFSVSTPLSLRLVRAGIFLALNMRHLLVYALLAILACALLAEGQNVDVGLPLQACANKIGSLNGDNLWVHFNGTRLNVNIPANAGSSTASDTLIYYQWTDITQLQRTGNKCAPLDNAVVETLLLSDCDCTLESFTNITDNVNMTGYVVKVFGCPSPQEELVLTATISVSNDTTQVTYNNTMEYSVEESFTYTTPYVQAQESIFYTPLELRKASR